jgi:hypothetical protein
MTPESAGTVAEIQGLYGAFSFPEKLLQKIWLRGEFDRARAITVDGRAVRVLHPGKWNLLGGPDFRGARLGIGEREVSGDVEVHLRAADWDAHGHARDRAYDNVVLHVVLFSPEGAHTTRGARGEIPVLALLPLLHHDLEEYAAEDAVEVLASRPAARIVEALGPVAPEPLRVLLREHARARWRQKVHFARLRVQRLGWDAACHQSALEILGFRFNRAPMLRIASRWPLGVWARGEIEAANVYREESWSLQGVRPANHPRARLAQYARWARERPAWPESLRTMATTWPAGVFAVATRDVRKANGFAAVRAEIAGRLCAGAIGGTRLDTLICDGLFPLVAGGGGPDLEGLWFNWFPGDLPASVEDGLRQLQVCDGRAQPACHGLAQGLLGWLIEREKSA